MERLQSSNCATQESINGSVWVEECSVHTRFSERVGKEMLPKEWQGLPKLWKLVCSRREKF